MKVHEIFEAKNVKCHYCKDEATQRLIWADGRGQVQTCDKHMKNAKTDVNKNKHPEIVGIEKL